MDEESVALINDIVEWLRTNPSEDDIYFYYSHLPSECVEVIDEAGLEAISRSLFSVDKYFKSVGVPKFCTDIVFYDQLQILRSLANIANHLDEKKYIMENYPFFVSMVSGKNLSGVEKVCGEFVAVWDSALMLLSCSSYIETRTYAKTLIGTINSAEGIKQKEEEIKNIILSLSKNVEGDYTSTGGEVESYVKILRGLGFLPEEMIVRLVSRSRDQYLDEDWGALDNILDALILIDAHGLEEAKKDYSNFCKLIWRYYALDVERDLVIHQESDRLRYNVNPSENIVRLAEYFQGLWVDEKVFSGEAENKTLEYVHGLNIDQLKVFKSFFKVFVENLIPLKILLDGFDIDYILYRLDKSVSQTQFTGMVAEVISAVQDKEVKMLVSKYLYGIYRIMQYGQVGHISANSKLYPNTHQTLSYDVLHKNTSQTPSIQSINDLVKIFTKENILSGNTDSMLRQYFAQHGQQDQKSFVENVERFLKSSLEVSTILQPLSISLLIDNLKSLPGAQKIGYCKKVLDENTFADRLVAEKLLKILVNLY